MPDEKKNKNKETEIELPYKKHIKPGDIVGKIEISDTRERRDGPGGN